MMGFSSLREFCTTLSSKIVRSDRTFKSRIWHQRNVGLSKKLVNSFKYLPFYHEHQPKRYFQNKKTFPNRDSQAEEQNQAPSGCLGLISRTGTRTRRRKS